MKLNRKTVRKLASLSALGAGAIALTADKAEATIISNTVNTTVGFSPGSVSSWGSGILPGSSSASFFFARSSSGSSRSGSRRVNATGGGSRFVKFAYAGAGLTRGLATFNAGAKLLANPVTSVTRVGLRQWSRSTFQTGSSSSNTHTSSFTSHRIQGRNNFTDKFALFTYTGNSGPLFGWVELTYKVTDAFGSNPTFGPDLTVIAYGVDDSGAQIAAGDVGGGAATPEPSAIYMSGLGALVLGAEGLRRWRAAKRQVAPVPAA
jgi:hypothetical protein